MFERNETVCDERGNRFFELGAGRVCRRVRIWGCQAGDEADLDAIIDAWARVMIGDLSLLPDQGSRHCEASANS